MPSIPANVRLSEALLRFLLRRENSEEDRYTANAGVESLIMGHVRKCCIKKHTVGFDGFRTIFEVLQRH